MSCVHTPVPLIATLGKCMKDMESDAQGDQHWIRPLPCVQCPGQARSFSTSHLDFTQCKLGVRTAGGNEARVIKHLQEDCACDQK